MIIENKVWQLKYCHLGIQYAAVISVGFTVKSLTAARKTSIGMYLIVREGRSVAR